MARFGPWKPNMIETWPEIMLMIEAGTKNGVIRRGPRFSSSALVSSISGRPPMPEPTRQPMRSRLFLAELVVGRQAGVAHRLDRCRQAVVDERVHVTRILGREIVLDLEALHLAGEAARVRRRVELRDVGDAGSPGEQVLPAFRDAVADRADQARAR